LLNPTPGENAAIRLSEHPTPTHPKPFPPTKEKGLPAALNVADDPSALIVPAALFQLVNTKPTIELPETPMLVATMLASAKLAPAAALISMVPVADRVGSFEEMIVESSAGLPVQEKSKTIALEEVGQQHKMNIAAATSDALNFDFMAVTPL
jgi:hypothetical protein